MPSWGQVPTKQFARHGIGSLQLCGRNLSMKKLVETTWRSRLAVKTSAFEMNIRKLEYFSRSITIHGPNPWNCCGNVARASPAKDGNQDSPASIAGLEGGALWANRRCLALGEVFRQAGAVPSWASAVNHSPGTKASVNHHASLCLWASDTMWSDSASTTITQIMVDSQYREIVDRGWRLVCTGCHDQEWPIESTLTSSSVIAASKRFRTNISYDWPLWSDNCISTPS